MMRFIFLKAIILWIVPFLAFGQKANYKPLIEAAKKAHSSAVIVLKDGEKVVEYRKNSKREKIYSRSVTKSIVALAVAKLLTENKIEALDTPVARYYPEWKQGLKKDITIRHLMNHTSGLQNVDMPKYEIYPSPDAVQLALCASVVDTPGTEVVYNNKATNLLSGIIEKVSGQKVDKYLENTLFNAMNITDYDWQSDKAGNPYAMSGFKVYPSDLAKLGHLVLQKGSWNGNQLISEQWMNEILAKGHPKSINGLLWWRIPKNKNYIIDDNIIQTLDKAGIPDSMLAKAKNMKGNYDSRGDAVQAILNEFENRRDFFAFRKATLGQDLPLWRKSLGGPIIGYKAEGSSGEYLFVYPELDIVAVRMIKVTDDYNPKTDNFSRFGEMVYKLFSGKEN